MKNTVVLWVLVLVLASLAGLAFSKGVSLSGKVVAVEGKKVTVTIEKGDAAQVKVGSTVEIELRDGSKAVAPGTEQLQGC